MASTTNSLATPCQSGHEVADPDARFWDRIARKYAADPIADMAGYERTIERCRELLTTEDHVIELGCGTGTTALNLAPGLAHITGTDLSPEMIAIANERLAAAGFSNADFVAATSTDRRFAAGRYDAVLAMNLLDLVPDIDATLARAREMLSPGGLFISKTPCLGEMSRLIRLAIPVMRIVGKAPSTVAVFTASQLQASMLAAGFEITAVEFHGTKGRDARPFMVAKRR